MVIYNGREPWNVATDLGSLIGRVVLRLLRLKFGPLDPEIEERVHAADADRLLGWSERILTAERLQDVFQD